MTSSPASTTGSVRAVLDEIDELSRQARTSRDPVLEQRLVELRYEAFAQLPRTPGRPTWPPAFDDPFPEGPQVPVIPVDELNVDTLGGAVTHHGSLHVTGVLVAAEVAWLIEHINRSFEARQRVADGGPEADAAPWFVPFHVGRNKAQGFGSERFVRAVDAPRALNELARLFAERGVLDVITAYLGERPAMIANKWILRRTPSGLPGLDYHQDGAFLGEGIRTIDCWIALDRCGPGTGRPGIDLVATRMPGVLPGDEQAVFPWSQSPETVAAAVPEAPVVSPVFEAGDALFFDELLVHRTAPGVELGPRYAVESWFVAPSSYPAHHVPVVV